MNLWTYITIFVLTLTLTCGQKKKNQYDEDEKRPYEFGFNIDGQQHRHEAKDSKGIVTGEFGFITADGIYHVTVYATDEEGRFKIISMKSIRVSPPLDGSGDQTPVKSPATSERPSSHSPSPIPPTQHTPPAPKYTPPPHLAQFTTHKPLILPSCGSCSIPSTIKPPPGSKPNQFTFQTSAFKPKPPKSPPNAVPPSTPAKYPAHVEYPNNPPETISNEVLPPFQQQPSKPLYPSQPSISTQPSQSFNPSYPSVPSQQFNPSKPSVSSQQFNPSYPSVPSQQYNPSKPSVPARPQAPKQPSIPQDAFFPGLIHPQSTGNEQSSPVIEGQMPPGVTTDDMLHLLYKFNYTLGFHGHYETGYRNGAKIGGYFVNGRDGISRIVEYVADENGYRPKILYLKLGLDSPDTPKEGNEKDFEVKGRIFEWYSLR